MGALMRAGIRAVLIASACAAVTLGAQEAHQKLSAKFQLASLRVVNATVLDQAAIESVSARWRGRWIGGFELAAIQRELSLLYEERGYKGSGVVLGDQAIERGEVVFHAREVTIDRIEFSPTLRWVRPRVLDHQIWPDTKAPLNVNRLQERIGLLRDSPHVKRINADLAIGDVNPSTATLVLKVEEPPPIAAWVSAANNRNPGIGAVRREVGAQHRSLLGWGDQLEARAGRTEGLSDSSVSYAFPIPGTHFTVLAARSKGDSRAIEPRVFKDLDILAVTSARSVGINALFVKTPTHVWSAGALREDKTSETSLLGFPFSFTPGIAEGESTIRANRLSTDYAWRGTFANASVRIIATRGTVRPVADAGLPGAVAPDFRLYQLGATAAKSMLDGALILQARLDAQTTSQTLPPAERLSFGGVNGVRGYRENLFLRDRGAIVKLETGSKVYEPVTFAKTSFTLFADVGQGTHAFSRDDGLPKRISSVGIATEVTLLRYLRLNATYAWPSNRAFKSSGNLQDRGVHFAVTVGYPARD